MDAVTLGAWAQPLHPPTTIADIGTGCGILALMLAHRFPQSQISAIDTHLPSVEEARGNVRAAGLNDRITVQQASVHTWQSDPLDWMVCNPPFFSGGTPPQDDRRKQARFLDQPPVAWAERIHALSHAHSAVSMIGPPELMDQMNSAFFQNGWYLCHETAIANQPGGPIIRRLSTWSRAWHPLVQSHESYRQGRDWSNWYLELTADFYLNLRPNQ
jgi:tRNA1Val (adenine37-N6)-methyltransferase